MPHSERLAALIKAAVELTTQEAPDWEFIAARLLNFQLSKKLEKQAASAGIRSECGISCLQNPENFS